MLQFEITVGNERLNDLNFTAKRKYKPQNIWASRRLRKFRSFNSTNGSSHAKTVKPRRLGSLENLKEWARYWRKPVKESATYKPSNQWKDQVHMQNTVSHLRGSNKYSIPSYNFHCFAACKTWWSRWQLGRPSLDVQRKNDLLLLWCVIYGSLVS